MDTIASNMRQKPTKIRIILMLLLFMITAQLITPITAYTDSANTKGYNGTDAGEGASVGRLYWGGSTERTALLFYIVNNNTKQIMTARELGVLGSGNMGALVYTTKPDSDGNSRARYFVPASNSLWVVDIGYWTHFGGIKVDAFYPAEDIPEPVHFDRIAFRNIYG